jgi:hypothetical protein
MDVSTFLKPYQKLALIVLMITFCSLVSGPILQAGFFSDDITNSLIPGSAPLYHQSLWRVIIGAMQNWLANGRLFPLSVISSVTIFNYFPAVQDYQIIRSLFIWASIFSFAWFIKIVTKNFAAALLFVFFLPLCWSLRDYPDPLTSFAIFLPLLAIFIAWTLIFYRYYQVSEQPEFLTGAIITFTCALCTYEVGVVTIFLLLTLMYCKPVHRQPQLWLEIKPFMILLGAFLLTTLMLHLGSTHVYDGIEINLSRNFWATFAAQFTAPFPLSYYLLSSRSGLSLAATLQHSNHFLAIFILAISSGGIVWLSQQLVLTRRSCVCFASMALFLLFVPAFLMAINQKYQYILHMGVGYIPVYIQYVGMGFLILSGFGVVNLLALPLKTKFKIHLSLGAVSGVIITLALLFNIASVNSINEKYKFNRVLVENAAMQGLLTSLPEKSFLIERVALWNTPDFYMLHAHKSLAGVIDLRDLHKILAFDKNNSSTAYHKYFLMSYHLPGTSAGYVLMGRAKQAQLAQIKNLKMTKALFITDVQIFISANSPVQAGEILQNLQQQLNLRPDIVNDLAQTYSENGKYWLITSLPKGRLKILI